MKAAYTVVINKNTHIVYVPDFDISTEGTDIENCIEMVKEQDLIFRFKNRPYGKTALKLKYSRSIPAVG